MFQKNFYGYIYYFLGQLFGGQLFELFAREMNLKKQSSVRRDRQEPWRDPQWKQELRKDPPREGGGHLPRDWAKPHPYGGQGWGRWGPGGT